MQGTKIFKLNILIFRGVIERMKKDFSDIKDIILEEGGGGIPHLIIQFCTAPLSSMYVCLPLYSPMDLMNTDIANLGSSRTAY